MTAESTSMTAMRAAFARHRSVVDDALRRFLGDPRRTPVLHDAMGWMLFGGGKRVRPAMCLTAAEAVGASDLSAALPAACAVEMVHTYSLVHDDLPAMDDDSERRGRPTVHVKFDEATAILAGDGLLTEAMRLVGDRTAYPEGTDPWVMLRVVEALGSASGRHGMVAGQVIDMGIEQRAETVEGLLELHARKTGELFRFSAFAGGLLGGGSEDDVARLAAYGELVGLAFQVADDVLDLYEDRDAGGRDEADTPSFPALIGEDESRRKASELADAALEKLDDFGPAADPLRAFARYSVERDH